MIPHSELSFKKCFAVGCDETIPLHRLMCRDHWDRLPMRLRSLVLETQRAWDRGGPLQPYDIATLDAQLHIAQIEGRPEVASIRADLDRIAGAAKARLG